MASTPRVRPARPRPAGRRHAGDGQPRHALRVPAQELPHEQHRPGRLRQHRGRRSRGGRLRPGRSAQHRHLAVRDRSQPQLRRLLGRPRRVAERSAHRWRLRAGLPRHRSLLRARDAQRARPRVQAPGHHADHQPHLLQPPAAPAGHPGAGPAGRRGGLQGARRLDGGAERLPQPAQLPALRHHRRHRGLDLLRHRRPGLHLRDRPGQLPPAVRADDRRVRGHPAGQRPTDRAATARPTSRRSRARRTPPATPCSSGKAPRGAVLRLRKKLQDQDLAGDQRRRRGGARSSRSTTRSTSR